MEKNEIKSQLCFLAREVYRIASGLAWKHHATRESSSLGHDGKIIMVFECLRTKDGQRRKFDRTDQWEL